MNIALPALVVFALLLPGFIARSRIKRAERSSLDYSPFGQIVTEAVLWAGGLHLLWLALAALFFGRHVQPTLLLGLVVSDAAAQARSISNLASELSWIAAYFGSLFAFAYGAPALIRAAIIRWRLDRAGAPLSPLLRFHAAPWYYLLTGADFPPGEEPDCIVVSAIVNISGRPWIYMGILDDFFLDPEGRLDRMVLEKVMRRPLDADKQPSTQADEELARFYVVDGDYFVLRYAETVTLNVEYIKLRPAA
ncbi:hypothetical protein ABT392_08320 [Paucibacter sp. JuS9]|uniref:hypothetical protein n=1 Tax=Paucibacter sp. JuS9 TaxID=3228748 RepID=UPI0037578106